MDDLRKIRQNINVPERQGKMRTDWAKQVAGGNALPRASAKRYVLKRGDIVLELLDTNALDNIKLSGNIFESNSMSLIWFWGCLGNLNNIAKKLEW